MKVSVVVDAREAEQALFPNGDVSEFVKSWALLEKSLRGSLLRAGHTITADLDAGRVSFTFVHPSTFVVDETTDFGIVAVRETPTVRTHYRCRVCREGGRRVYGPFICGSCTEDNRVCDDHVLLLPGSLNPVCQEHSPSCSAKGCSSLADLWCPGPRCRSREAWCRRHAATHGNSGDVAFCAGCLEALYPPCAQRDCSAIGSVGCDHVELSGGLCGERMCPRHARVWQVFGPQREGLGRCSRHSRLTGLRPDDILVQALGGSVLRGFRRPPTLASLRYVLMKTTGTNVSMAQAAAIAMETPRHHAALAKQLAQVVRENQDAWKRQANDTEETIRVHFAQLQAWLRTRGETNALTTLRATGWGRPRGTEPGKLFVQGEARYFPRALRDQASEALGFSIRMERNT